MEKTTTVVPGTTNYSEKEVNIGRNLSLDSIMVLQIDQNANYMVTMFGLEQDNCDERVLLSSGQKEMTLMKMCLLNNYEIERKPITNYMPSDYIEIYNEALADCRYDICMTMLHGLESHINQIHEEMNKVLLKGNKR